MAAIPFVLRQMRSRKSSRAGEPLYLMASTRKLRRCCSISIAMRPSGMANSAMRRPDTSSCPPAYGRKKRGEALDLEPVLESHHGNRHLILLHRGKVYAEETLLGLRQEVISPLRAARRARGCASSPVSAAKNPSREMSSGISVHDNATASHPRAFSRAMTSRKNWRAGSSKPPYTSSFEDDRVDAVAILGRRNFVPNVRGGETSADTPAPPSGTSFRVCRRRDSPSPSRSRPPRLRCAATAAATHRSSGRSPDARCCPGKSGNPRQPRQACAPIAGSNPALAAQSFA